MRRGFPGQQAPAGCPRTVVIALYNVSIVDLIEHIAFIRSITFVSVTIRSLSNISTRSLVCSCFAIQASGDSGTSICVI